MGIFGQNTVLNQYAPPFCVKSPVDGQVLVYDSVTKTFKNKDIDAGNGGTGAVAVDIHDDVGTGLLTSFVLPWLVTDKNTLLITIQGVKQHLNAFSISSAVTTTVIFTNAPELDDEIEFMVFLPAPVPVTSGLNFPVATGQNLSGSGDTIIGIPLPELFGMVRLPDLRIIPTGQVIIVKDESGKASINNIIITVSVPGQTIEGAPTTSVDDDYGYVKLYAGGDKDIGTEEWFIIN